MKTIDNFYLGLMISAIQAIVDKLGLLPHPEGGFYRETYRSIGSIGKESLPETFSGPRNYSTCIYFLLTSENFSAFHRIKQDEQWHFYDGSPLHIHVIDPMGNYKKHTIGNAVSENLFPQLIVEAGHWFASSVAKPNSYSLVGCTVAPGFDFADFELANKSQLTELYPQHRDVINKYCRA